MFKWFFMYILKHPSILGTELHDVRIQFNGNQNFMNGLSNTTVKKVFPCFGIT